MKSAENPYSIGVNISNPTQCLCASNLVWNDCLGRCERNCSYLVDVNAISVNQSNVLQCSCRQLYVWDTETSKCKATSNATICTCPKDLIWSPKELSCVRNCSKDPYASCVNPSNKQECDCVSTLFRIYVWSKAYQKCVPYCILGFEWNDTLQKCVYSYKLFAANPNTEADEAAFKRQTENQMKK